ncbi:glycerophosphodiester phosphodiesterase family protein [Salinimicrobium terrae]|uniref:glycerophosphodiester phosphodiesterase family protein n=1 Tax=Salinimicrobium terrae TaxID=470866 RepID=UPI000404A096|nr:glycerophosphodiester phosphodiesterase family protein [Salinimicrobium terrae]
MSVKNVISNPTFEVISHRGHVSQFPENCTEGFLSAVALGVHGLEMDLVISADKKVVVSHEPYMAAKTLITPDGKRISPSKQKEHNLYKMEYATIKQYKTGLIKSHRYRDQKIIDSYKPLLSEIFKKAEDFRKNIDLAPIKYYLEIKSKPQDYGIFQPYPREFAKLIMEIIRKQEMQESVIIKSFDANFLNTLKKEYPEIKTSYLLYKTPLHEGLSHLDFTPDVIAPYYKQIKEKEQIDEMQLKDLKVIPWTVNSKSRTREMITLGVDGIITDYPERILGCDKNARD